VLRVFKPEAEEERFSVLRLQGWRKGDYYHDNKMFSPEHFLKCLTGLLHHKLLTPRAGKK